jgi:hypothetical protein
MTAPAPAPVDAGLRDGARGSVPGRLRPVARVIVEDGDRR